MTHYEFKDLSFISEIKSIAIIGASKKRAYFFVRTFSETFTGKIYIIKPKLKQIDKFPNIPVYEKLIKIPEDQPIDFAFIAVPREKVPAAIEDCRLKGVKLAAIFSTNFADEGSEIGRALQDQILANARNKVRILGPNGMGLYYPRLGIRWRASLPLKWSGDNSGVGVVAQSGGLCNLIIHALSSKQMEISKAFSIGNAADINALDIINYFKWDSETKIIVCYIEGLPKGAGKTLIEVLKTCKKPVLFLKGGRTKVGTRAAVSHTASLVGDSKLWNSMIKQTGGILLDTLEDVVNVANYYNTIGSKLVENISMISLSGGYGVICSDILGQFGMNIPEFDLEIKKKLSLVLTGKGTSYNNPIDVSTMIYEPDAVTKMLQIICQSEKIDVIIFEIAPLYLAYQMRPDIDLSAELIKVFKKIKSECKKPIIIIIEDIGFDDLRAKLKRDLEEINIPVHSDILTVARMLRYMNNYVKRNQRLSSLT